MSTRAFPLAVLGLAALLSCSSQSTKQVVNSDAGAMDASSRVCIPGTTQRCLGQNLCDGVQVCADDGERYGACDCGSASGGTGGGSGGSDASGGGGGTPGSGGNGGSDATGGSTSAGTSGGGGDPGSGGASAGSGGGDPGCFDQACNGSSDCCATTPACNGINKCSPSCAGPQSSCQLPADCCAGFGCEAHLGANRCCGGQGVQCATFNDCCSPTATCLVPELVCGEGACTHSGFPCSGNSECCSGQCQQTFCLGG